MVSKYVVNRAIKEIATMLSGLSWEIAIGSGRTPAWVDNETLENELLRKDASVSLVTTDVTNDTLEFYTKFIITESISVSEYGVFKKAPNPWMYCRIVTDPIDLHAGLEFPVKIRIQITR